MVTNINREIFNLSEETNATVLETVSIETDNMLKLYVPRVMPNINMDSPKISILQTGGGSIFKNVVNRPATTGRLIKEKNYLETNFYSDSNVQDLESVSSNLIKEVKNSINDLANTNDLDTISISDKKMKYTIKKDSQVRVDFLNNKINRLSYKITNNTNYITELK